MTTKKQFQALSDFEITETMRQKGGGFVSRLGQLYRFADSENQAKLKETFAGYWCQYAAMTKRCPECGRTEICNCHHDGETQPGECWLQNDDADPNDMLLNSVPGKVVATGTVKLKPVESVAMAAIIAEHTQQVRELTQRIGELVQQVNERDAVIEGIRTAVRADFI